MESIGNRVRQIRDDHNMTQEQFGKKIGLQKAAVSKIEKSSRGLADAVYHNIIREFYVNEAWLMEGIGEKYNEKLRKDKEFMQNELQFMTDTLLEKQQAFFNSIKGYEEDERLEIITALEEIYSLLKVPSMASHEDDDTFLEYFETVSGMLLEINRYIGYLDSGCEINPHIIRKYIDSIEADLIQICSILLPEMDLNLENKPDHCKEASPGVIYQQSDILDKLYLQEGPNKSSGDRFRSFRKCFNLGLDYVSEKIDISRSYLEALEDGEALPTDIFLDRIRQHFNINSGWITSGRGSIYAVSGEDPAGWASYVNESISADPDDPILTMYKQLPAEDKDELSALIKIKFGRLGFKKKTSHQISGQDEEAATGNVFNKKRA